ncbi:MAG: DUF5677 domain-containing protein [Bacillota bacterium]
MPDKVEEVAAMLSDLAAETGRKTIRDASAFDRVLQLFFSRFQEGFRAVRLLVGEDCGNDAVILVRSLYEDTLNVLYIATDPEHLAALFLDYAQYRNWIYVTFLEKYYPEALRDIKLEELVKMKAEYERVRDLFPRRSSWHGKTIADLARLLNLSNLHETFYKVTCDITHGNVAGFYPLLTARDNRHIGVSSEDDEDYARDALALASQCYLAVLDLVNKHFGLGLEAELDKARREVAEVLNTLH